MNKFYICPHCDEDINMPDDCLTTENNTCQCQNCGSRFVIDADAEFVDGMWRDKTRLHEIAEAKL